jgi:hypothetical protein
MIDQPSTLFCCLRTFRHFPSLLQPESGVPPLTNLELSYELSLTSQRVTPNARRFLSPLALLLDGLACDDLTTVLPVHGGAAATALRQTGLVFDEARRLRMLSPLCQYVQCQYPPQTDDLERSVQFLWDWLLPMATLLGLMAELQPSSACCQTLRTLRPCLLAD